jgi:hypothetical protein
MRDMVASVPVLVAVPAAAAAEAGGVWVGVRGAPMESSYPMEVVLFSDTASRADLT